MLSRVEVATFDSQSPERTQYPALAIRLTDSADVWDGVGNTNRCICAAGSPTRLGLSTPRMRFPKR